MRAFERADGQNFLQAQTQTFRLKHAVSLEEERGVRAKGSEKRRASKREGDYFVRDVPRAREEASNGQTFAVPLPLPCGRSES